MFFIQITELRSEISKEQREHKEKLAEMQKRHNERISEMQSKLTSLSRQIVTMNKAAKPKVIGNTGSIFDDLDKPSKITITPSVTSNTNVHKTSFTSTNPVSTAIASVESSKKKPKKPKIVVTKKKRVVKTSSESSSGRTTPDVSSSVTNTPSETSVDD